MTCTSVVLRKHRRVCIGTRSLSPSREAVWRPTRDSCDREMGLFNVTRSLYLVCACFYVRRSTWDRSRSLLLGLHKITTEEWMRRLPIFRWHMRQFHFPSKRIRQQQGKSSDRAIAVDEGHSRVPAVAVWPRDDLLHSRAAVKKKPVFVSKYQ